MRAGNNNKRCKEEWRQMVKIPVKQNSGEEDEHGRQASLPTLSYEKEEKQ